MKYFKGYRKVQLYEHLYKIHHKVKLKLDAICQEAGDLNVEEFMQVYESLKQDVGKMRAEQVEFYKKNPNVGKIPLTGINRNFQEDMINDMDVGL